MPKTPEEKAAEAAAKAEAKAKADAEEAAAKAAADADKAAKEEEARLAAEAAKNVPKDPRAGVWADFLAKAEAQAKDNGTLDIFNAQKERGEFDKIPDGFVG